MVRKQAPFPHSESIKIMQMPKLTSSPLVYSRLLIFRKISKKLRFLRRNAQFWRKTEAILSLNLLFCQELVRNRIIFLKVTCEFGTITALPWASG
jgi:hypothetical protein